jgi:hypothetical protein
MVRPERVSLKSLRASAWVPQDLVGDILIAGRDPSIAENGTHAVWQTTVPWKAHRCSTGSGISDHKICPSNHQRPQP